MNSWGSVGNQTLEIYRGNDLIGDGKKKNATVWSIVGLSLKKQKTKKKSKWADYAAVRT